MQWSQVTGPQCICHENKYSPLQTCVTRCYRGLSSCRVSGRSFSFHEESTIWLGESVAKRSVGLVIEKKGKTKTPKSRIIMLCNPSTKDPGHYQIMNCYQEAQSPAWLKVWSWERHMGIFGSLFPSYFWEFGIKWSCFRENPARVGIPLVSVQFCNRHRLRELGRRVSREREACRIFPPVPTQRFSSLHSPVAVGRLAFTLSVVSNNYLLSFFSIS